uniref:Putative secreted protein n=1 Tax=Anopheles triannulatus TaxID=58253 RepID=A0A2M4B376_9DIPT
MPIFKLPLISFSLLLSFSFQVSFFIIDGLWGESSGMTSPNCNKKDSGIVAALNCRTYSPEGSQGSLSTSVQIVKEAKPYHPIDSNHHPRFSARFYGHSAAYQTLTQMSRHPFGRGSRGRIPGGECISWPRHEYFKSSRLPRALGM